MEHWFMLSMVGQDQPGIVSRLSADLCQHGCYLGDSSMARLGANFTIMLMVQFDGDESAFDKKISPLAKSLGLKYHVHPIEGNWEHHVPPDVRISIYTEDRKGILEDVTGALSEAGLNISNLESNIGDKQETPTYYIHIEGTTTKGLDPLYNALDVLSNEKKMTAQLIPINA